MKMYRAHNPAGRHLWCEPCGHRGYLSRSDAKVVRRRHPSESLSVFGCPHTDGLFHLGHRPSALTSGQVNRAQMAQQKRDASARRTGNEQERTQ